MQVCQMTLKRGKEGKWNLEEETSVMWYKMANCITLKGWLKMFLEKIRVKITHIKKVGGGTHQDVCRPTQPQTLSSRPI